MTLETIYSIEGKGLKLNNAQDCAEFVAEIKKQKGLTEVRLSGNTFGVDAAKAIAEALKDQDELKVLLI
jgi:Ran GTPase-activating protein 1